MGSNSNNSSSNANSNNNSNGSCNKSSKSNIKMATAAAALVVVKLLFKFLLERLSSVFHCIRQRRTVFLPITQSHATILYYTQIHLKINGGRTVEGVLRGYDPFMNLVLDEGIEINKQGERNQVGEGGGSLIRGALTPSMLLLPN